MSPCFYHSKEEFSKALKIVDPIEFMLDYVMPHLTVKNKKDTVAVFPVCSVKKIGKMDQLLALSQLCANEVTMIDSNCCGFAGDRGFLIPELNEHGLRELKAANSRQLQRRLFHQQNLRNWFRKNKRH